MRSCSEELKKDIKIQLAITAKQRLAITQILSNRLAIEITLVYFSQDKSHADNRIDGCDMAIGLVFVGSLLQGCTLRPIGRILRLNFGLCEEEK